MRITNMTVTAKNASGKYRALVDLTECSEEDIKTLYNCAFESNDSTITITSSTKLPAKNTPVANKTASTAIRNIDYNEEVGLVVVVFTDGTIIKKKMCEGDNFDLNVGIALCIAEKLYGSVTQFHKEVNRLKNIIDDKHTKRASKLEIKKHLRETVTNDKEAKKED